MKRTACIIALAAMASTVTAGPFGLRQGMTLDEVGPPAVLDGVGAFPLLRQVPVPVPDFPTYKPFVCPRHGLYGIEARTAEIKCEPDGRSLIDRFDDVVRRISAKYDRKGEDESTLKPGSTLAGRNDWLEALRRGDRSIVHSWGPLELYSNEEGLVGIKPALPDSLLSIELKAESLFNDAGQLVLTYWFRNVVGCTQELKEKRDAGF